MSLQFTYHQILKLKVLFLNLKVSSNWVLGIKNIIVGDFNFSDDLEKLRFADKSWSKLIKDSDISQLITDYTRISDSSSTCIDHDLTNRTNIIVNSWTLSISLSDHKAIYTVHKLNSKLNTKEFSFFLVSFSVFWRFLNIQIQVYTNSQLFQIFFKNSITLGLLLPHL